MGNRLLVALSLGLALATAACGDDDATAAGDAATDGGGRDSSTPGMDSGLDGKTGDATIDGTIIVLPDGKVIEADTSVPNAGEVSKRITLAGGSVTSADGNLTIEFPPNTFTRPTTVTIKVVNPAPNGAQGPTYEVGPTFEQFNQQGQSRRITAKIKYRDSDLAGGSPAALQVGLFEGGGWIDLPTKVYAADKALRIELPRLGLVGLYTGVCKACAQTCDPATCVFPTGSPTGIPGKCVPYGKGCGRCVPVCDLDNDGACAGSPGSEQPGNDCNPNDPNVSPFAEEICGNGVDDNCNQIQDEGCTPCDKGTICPEGLSCREGFCMPCSADCNVSNCTLYLGEGVPPAPGRCQARGLTCNECVPSCDLDGDGYCPPGSPAGRGQPAELDCDDTKPGVNVAMLEVCGNGIDDNCDGHIDDGCQDCETSATCPVNTHCTGFVCAACTTTCSPETCTTGTCRDYGNGCKRCAPSCDTDGDGYCTTAVGDIPGNDCIPNDPAIYPNATEICNGKDDDCDFMIDENCKPCTTDAQCEPQQACLNGVCTQCEGSFDPGQVFGGSETDRDAGVRAVEFNYGNSCRKAIPACDKDKDGFCDIRPGDTILGGDCEGDMDPNVNSAHIEVCGNGKDDNCNGAVDENCGICAEALMCGEAQYCTSGK